MVEKYEQEVNTIFSCLEKLKTTWPEQDNINYINNLKEYKQDVIEFRTAIEQIKVEKKSDQIDR